MKIKTLLELLMSEDRINYAIQCSTDLGLKQILPRILRKKYRPEDYYSFDAEQITREKARQIENDSRRAPQGGSLFNIFFIWGLEKIPSTSVGPLLKAVEEGKYTRFIFQSLVRVPKTDTLTSRCVAVELPFFSRAAVFKNMKSLSLDGLTAHNEGLYDGTIDGTTRTLSMRETTREIQRSLRPTSVGTLSEDLIMSNAFLPLIENLITAEERNFLALDSSFERRMLIAIKVANR